MRVLLLPPSVSVCICVILYVCVWKRGMWTSALRVRGKKMSYGISDYVFQCFFVEYLAPPHPPPLKALATAKVSGDWNQTQNSGQTWNHNRETVMPRNQLFGFMWLMWCLNFTHCFAQSKQCFRMKRKAVSKIYGAVHQCETSYSMQGWFSLCHVCHWVLWKSTTVSLR